MRKTRAARGASSVLGATPSIILVEPQLGENIGSVARGMLNFGLCDLRIVNPRDGWPNEKAIAMASGAVAVLDNAKIVSTTEEAIGDLQFVLAMTARPRESLLPIFSPQEAAKAMKSRIDRGENCGVLLGPERAGLSNEDVMRADGVLAIPVNPAFASLNLAMAALVFAYEWSKAAELSAPASDLDVAPRASRSELEGLFGHLFAELETARYFFPADKRPVQERKLRNALVRADLTEGEVRMLRGVVKALADRRHRD